MPLSDALLPEYDHEMSVTRKTLERVPDDKFDWKPHAKSSTLGGLATHIATLPSWAVYAITQDSIDIAPVDGPPPRVEPATTNQELLQRFDDHVAKARTAIAGASDQELMKPWTLKAGGRDILTIPKVGVLRSFVMSHGIHHRGQLSVYLRLNDIPVPSIYGPSADEGAF